MSARRKGFVLLAIAGLLALSTASCSSSSSGPSTGPTSSVPRASPARATGVYGWGANRAGQLGTAAPATSVRPARLAQLTDVTAIAAGEAFGLALHADGTVSAWGRNTEGELGIASKAGPQHCAAGPCAVRPVAVRGLDKVAAIAARGTHAMALLSDGTVMTWGSNIDGELGNGTYARNSSGPVRVRSIRKATAVAAGDTFDLALLADGTVLGWGSIRELGNQGAAGSQCLGGECLSEPVPVSGLTGVTAIAAGGTHSLALLRNGTVVAWGLNDTGQLGTGNFGGDVTVPVAVQGLRDATGITAGEGFSLAVRRNGTVWAWGTGASGQLGTGRISGSAVPVPVLGATDVVSVAAGFAHSLALRRDGTVLAWGDNRGNGLATGSTGVRRHCAGAGSCRTKPAHVLGLGKVIAIAAGGGATVGDFSLAQA